MAHRRGKIRLKYFNMKTLPSMKTADLLRKHGGKTGEELKAEGK